jgi:hypothetical protein
VLLHTCTGHVVGGRCRSCTCMTSCGKQRASQQPNRVLQRSAYDWDWRNWLCRRLMWVQLSWGASMVPPSLPFVAVRLSHGTHRHRHVPCLPPKACRSLCQSLLIDRQWHRFFQQPVATPMALQQAAPQLWLHDVGRACCRHTTSGVGLLPLRCNAPGTGAQQASSVAVGLWGCGFHRVPDSCCCQGCSVP